MKRSKKYWRYGIPSCPVTIVTEEDLLKALMNAHNHLVYECDNTKLIIKQ